MKIDVVDIAWLAGLLEGEGYFGYTSTQTVCLAMCDEDVVYRVANLMTGISGRLCKVSTRNENDPARRVQYYTRIHGPEARIVMKSVVKYMGRRRRQKIWQCLNKHKGPTKKYKKYEHPKPDNVISISRRA